MISDTEPLIEAWGASGVDVGRRTAATGRLAATESRILCKQDERKNWRTWSRRLGSNDWSKEGGFRGRELGGRGEGFRVAANGWIWEFIV